MVPNFQTNLKMFYTHTFHKFNETDDILTGEGRGWESLNIPHLKDNT